MTTASEILLYHYTTKQGLAGIRRDGQINLSESKPGQPRAISLTSDSTSYGHGLHDGRKIEVHDAPYVQHYIAADGNLHCYDHTECRIVLRISTEDTCLIKASDYHDDSAMFGMDVAGWNPAKSHVPDNDVKTTAWNLKRGLLARKSESWWYYTKPIPLDTAAFLIQIRDPLGAYVQVDP